MNDYEILKKEVEELKAFKKSLESSNTIPLNIDQSFRARFFNISDLSVSSKAANSEDASVRNAADNGSTVVMDNPDGFLEIEINNVTYYIPYFT